eukprot:GFYU01000964.1.p1 GENE.GFYU01000964.1~~GFYU01000964.1.p1  ORF type:complete len:311 (+),score=105.82 GFYU01000964.1:120-1052(+)
MSDAVAALNRLSVSAQVTCGQCEEQPASLHCQQCDEDMCKDCAEDLHKKGKMKQHEIVPIEKAASAPVPAATAPSAAAGAGNPADHLCKDHEGEVRTLFCTNDRKIVCAQCLVIGSCTGHACKPLKAAWEEAHKRLEFKTDFLSQHATKLEKFVESLETLKKNINTEAESLEADVKKKMAELRTLLADKKTHLNDAVTATEQEKLDLLKKQVSDLQDLQKEREASVKEAAELLSLQDPYDFFDQLWGLEGKVDAQNDFRVNFEPATTPEFNKFLDTVQQRKQLASIELMDQRTLKEKADDKSKKKSFFNF